MRINLQVHGYTVVALHSESTQGIVISLGNRGVTVS
jgi:hypothetical protein